MSHGSKHPLSLLNQPNQYKIECKKNTNSRRLCQQYKREDPGIYSQVGIWLWGNIPTFKRCHKIVGALFSNGKCRFYRGHLLLSGGGGGTNRSWCCPGAEPCPWSSSCRATGAFPGSPGSSGLTHTPPTLQRMLQHSQNTFQTGWRGRGKSCFMKAQPC